jgi:hypothetical protein
MKGLLTAVSENEVAKNFFKKKRKRQCVMMEFAEDNGLHTSKKLSPLHVIA